MCIYLINKATLNNHGEAVAPWLTPYGGAATCGVGAGGKEAPRSVCLVYITPSSFCAKNYLVL